MAIKMNSLATLSLLLITLTITVTQTADATLNHRLLRRQSDGTSETESTTPSSSGSSTQPPRLYPDLPRPPSFIPQFGRNPNLDNNGRTPLVPFGFQMPNSRQMEPPFRPLQPRPMSPLERLQSQTFTNGLGRRLLSMIGIKPQNETTTRGESENVTSSNLQGNDAIQETMRALRNSTVLKQLSSGVQSVYGSLSRTYNSTVQQQLDLLQERYKKELANSTDPRLQRMAQQVPLFFKTMAMRVNEAQENLNRVWRQVAHVSNNSNGGVAEGVTRQAQTMAPRSSNSFDPLILDGGNDFSGNGGFLNNLGRSFGFGPDAMDDPMNPRQDIGSRLMDFWHNQVQPQMGMVRGQLMRIWRELMSSGALRPNNMGGRGRGDMGPGNASTDVEDDILKDVEITDPELMNNPQNGGGPGRRAEAFPPMIPQFQNGIVAMQRELNQLWNGLTNSLQGAISMISARRNNNNNNGMNMMNGGNPAEMDPAENEISDKLKDLSKIQRDADIVYDTVQRQQQAQQRPSFTDRFRNLFNMDLGSIDQLGNRVGESVSRFTNMIGDVWSR